MDLARKIEHLIKKEKLIEPGDRVLLGASGGIDSTVLFYLLLGMRGSIPCGIGAAHVNHMMRGEESDRDETFVRTLARENSVPFYVERINIRGEASRRGLSVQHAGRDARYGFFERIAAEYGFDRIAIAHNLDDQVETFILRIIKGTGLKGLASIPVRRGKIIRPLLGIYRHEIEDYAKRNAIRYTEDSSNKKVVYERNFVRKKIIPGMEELNPSIKEKVLGLLDDFTALNRSLERTAEGFLEQHCEEGNGRVVLPVMPLRLLDEEVRFRVITGALFRIAKLFIPLREHIRLIDHILHSTKPNLVVDLPGMIRARRTYQSLVFSRKTPVVPVMETSPIRNGCNRCIPLGICLEVTSADVAGDISETFSSIKTESGRETAFFDKDMVGDLYARTFRKGDRFSPLGMEHSVKLKDFFISMKIPKEDRAGIPLLLSGDSVIWIIGYRIDHRYRVTDRTKSILKVTVHKIEECRHAGQGA